MAVFALLAAFALPIKVYGQEARCLFASEQADLCDLTAIANGFRITVSQDGDKAGLILFDVLPPAPNGDPNLVDTSGVDVNSDLEAGVTGQTINASDAELILNELKQSPDFSYVAPVTPESLKNELGFNPQTPLAPMDLVDLIRVHIQLALGFSPTTTAYLAMKMGITARAPASEEIAPIVSTMVGVQTEPVAEPVIEPSIETIQD
ncbi:MAG TPA: hypothetical protein VM432_09955 [Bdellovibrionales bacterium]|nr:hypothetical protein [Bdellovibrionales bacterium]